MMGDRMNLRQAAFVRFINNTRYSVEIIWINVCTKDKIKVHSKDEPEVHDEEKPYGILAPDSYLDVNTYSSHPWIFRECMSKSRMTVAGKEVFLARPWFEEHRRLEFRHPINVPLRTMISIEMPALDLRQLCLLNIAKIFKSKEDINQLEIPVTLQRELIQMIVNKIASDIQLTN